jgi:hypothetical protein
MKAPKWTFTAHGDVRSLETAGDERPKRRTGDYGRPSHQLKGLLALKSTESWHATSTRSASFARIAFTSFP